MEQNAQAQVEQVPKAEGRVEDGNPTDPVHRQSCERSFGGTEGTEDCMLQVQFFDEIANVPVGWMNWCSRFRSANHRADPEGRRTP